MISPDQGGMMTDTSTASQPSAPITPTTMSKDSGSQAWVAFAIVGALLILGCGCLYVAVIKDSVVGAALAIVGTIVGIFGNALAAPTGIGSVIAQAMKKTPPVTP